MSRSFKKIAIIKDQVTWMKRYANKKVRRTPNIPNGKAYRKLFDSWDICDYKFMYFSKQELIEQGYCKDTFHKWYIK